MCVDNDRRTSFTRAQQDLRVLPDSDAERAGDLRVVDESGDDYLFSSERFVAIDVPAAVKASLLKASVDSIAPSYQRAARAGFFAAGEPPELLFVQQRDPMTLARAAA